MKEDKSLAEEPYRHYLQSLRRMDREKAMIHISSFLFDCVLLSIS
jgi:hypothetical protein